MAILRSSWSTLRQKWTQANSIPAFRRTFQALFWLPLGICFTETCYSVKSVTGRSMQPTLNPDTSLWHDIVIFDHWAIKVDREYRRGDVVAIKSPYDSKLIVKRIVALPGDKVQTLPPYPDPEVTIPEGHVWVEGDEPFKSEDSNYFGPIAQGLIDAKLAYIIWPWNRIGSLREPRPPNPKAPRTLEWRAQKADFDRAERRKARVEIGQSPSPSASSESWS